MTFYPWVVAAAWETAMKWIEWGHLPTWTFVFWGLLGWWNVYYKGVTEYYYTNAGTGYLKKLDDVEFSNLERDP